LHCIIEDIDAQCRRGDLRSDIAVWQQHGSGLQHDRLGAQPLAKDRVAS
jgi:hypothetical protein